MPLFRTRFAQPSPPTGLTATADAEASTVTLAWAASADPYLEAYILRWRADDGQDVEVYRGTATSYVHGRARLGVNSYQLVVWNGDLESDPAFAEATLTGRVPGAGMALVEGSDRLIVDLLIDDLSWEPNLVRTVLRPLDRPDPIVRKGVPQLATGSLRIRVSGDDRIQTAYLREMAAGDSPVIVKDPHGRVWAVSLQPPQIAYQAGGWEGITVQFDEVSA